MLTTLKTSVKLIYLITGHFLEVSLENLKQFLQPK